MKKKLVFFSLLISFFSNLVIFLLVLYNFEKIQDNLIRISLQSFSSLESEVHENILDSSFKKLESIQKRFEESMTASIKKDALSIGPLVEENSFTDLRRFLSQVYEFDKELKKVVFVDSENRLWSYIDKDFKEGLDLGTMVSIDRKAWVGTYKGKKVRKEDPFISLLFSESSELKMYEVKKNGEVNPIRNLSGVSQEGNLIVLFPVIIEEEFLGNLLYEFNLDLFNNLLKNEKVLIENNQKSITTAGRKSSDKIEKLSQGIFSNVKYIIALLMGIVFLITFAIFYLLGAWITKPILKLTESMGVVAGGNYIECEVSKTNDEIEFLGNHFNQMIKALVKRDKEIFEYQNNLEEILSERTKQLDQERSINIQNSKLASLGEMAAGIAHEINNPLAIIALKVKLGQKILEKEKIKSPKISDSFSVIKETVDRMSQIIAGLKEFSRNDNEKSNLEDNDLNDIVEKTLVLCTEKIKEAGIELRLNLEKESISNCNKVQISQVVLNIINNAYYVISNQAEGEKWIEINLSGGEQFHRIEILNSGEKISQEIVDKVLEPFFTTKPEGEGTGLGLSVSRGIIQSHGGELSIDMQKDNTCFVIELPKAS